MLTFTSLFNPSRYRYHVPIRHFISTSIKLQSHSGRGQDILFQEIKTLYKDPNIDAVKRSNEILDIFKKAQLQSIFDPRYQSVISNIKNDIDIRNDFIFELNRIFEVYHQNKQHDDDYKFEAVDYSKSKKNSRTFFGKHLTKKQSIAIYFGSMSALLVAVTMYGLQDLNIFQFTGLFGLVLWISFTFNPF